MLANRMFEELLVYLLNFSFFFISTSHALFYLYNLHGREVQQAKSWIHHDDGPVSVILYSSSQTEDVEVPKTLKPVVNYSSSSAFCRCNLYRGNSSRMFGSRLSIAGSQATNGNI